MNYQHQLAAIKSLSTVLLEAWVQDYKAMRTAGLVEKGQPTPAYLALKRKDRRCGMDKGELKGCIRLYHCTLIRSIFDALAQSLAVEVGFDQWREKLG